jgi:hypothetical protein
LPNHVPPWLGFHADAWAAIVLTLVSAYVLLKTPNATEWHGLTLLTFAMLAVVVIQYATGLIHSFGVAWTNMAFLLGLLVALLAGSAWERVSRLQCADLLFMAVVVGAVVSVGLQIHQWLDLEPAGAWILRSSGSRHYANMVQPNQLASLARLDASPCGNVFGHVLAVWPGFDGIPNRLDQCRADRLSSLGVAAIAWLWPSANGGRWSDRFLCGVCACFANPQ